MNLPEAIALIARLPPEKQAEVFDFVEFLSRKTVPPQPRTDLTPLEDEPYCGMWKDREEMADSLNYVRKLRRREWERHE